MKYIDSEHVLGLDVQVLELTRRNLESLLKKLNDPASKRMLIDCDDQIAVRAVEDVDHYSDRSPGVVYMPSTGESF